MWYSVYIEDNYSINEEDLYNIIKPICCKYGFNVRINPFKDCAWITIVHPINSFKCKAETKGKFRRCMKIIREAGYLLSFLLYTSP